MRYQFSWERCMLCLSFKSLSPYYFPNKDKPDLTCCLAAHRARGMIGQRMEGTRVRPSAHAQRNNLSAKHAS